MKMEFYSEAEESLEQLTGQQTWMSANFSGECIRVDKILEEWIGRKITHLLSGMYLSGKN